TSAVIVGQSGLGRITFDAGSNASYGSITTATAFLNSGPPRGGDVSVVHGGTLQLGTATIAQAGRGTLTVGSGWATPSTGNVGTVTISGDLVTADQSTAVGNVAVGGAGSTLTVAGNLILSRNGRGGVSLSDTAVTNGAHMTVGQTATIGVAANSSGGLEV